MMKLLAELKRRQMFRVAAAYAVVAWLLLQVVNNVAPVLDLPVWVARAFLLALVIGFPIALLFVWMRELAPADASAPRPATTKLDYVLVGGLAAVIALLLYQQLAPTGTTTVEGKGDAGTAAQTNAGTGISIAVLPFANLSDEREQEFFSDGMTDEIMTALAKIQRLSVVARESAFQYKGERNDMRVVGQALNAQYLINGSVRRAGNRVRITAQLVRTNDGVGLWTDNYDRELTDVFAIQEEIAQAIAGALSVPLGLRQGQQLVSSRTGNLDTYQQYLRAKASMRARARPEEQIAILEPVVARDPTYAPAWALLARAYGFAAGTNVFTFRGSVEEARALLRPGMDKAEMAAREAIRLDPMHSGGYSSLGDVENRRGRKLAADELREKAMALDPGDAENLERHAAMLGGAGRLQDALRIKQQLAVLEPFVPAYNLTYANLLLSLGEREAAIRMLEAITPDPNILVARNVALARANILDGRNSEAEDFLLAAAPAAGDLRGELETAARIVRAAPPNAAAKERLPLFLPFAVYAYLGAYDRVMDFYERSLDIGNGFTFTNQMWAPEFAPMRKTERFKTIMRRAGYVDYWRARGWPDLCRPVGADDFECD
jgi:TolB-like protein/Tfp pilus assembly protein PilF